MTTNDSPNQKRLSGLYDLIFRKPEVRIAERLRKMYEDLTREIILNQGRQFEIWIPSVGQFAPVPFKTLEVGQRFRIFDNGKRYFAPNGDSVWRVTGIHNKHLGMINCKPCRLGGVFWVEVDVSEIEKEEEIENVSETEESLCVMESMAETDDVE